MLIFLPVLGVMLIPLIKRITGRLSGSFLAVIPAILFCWSLSYWELIIDGRTLHVTVSWLPQLGIEFSLGQDGLSYLFTLLITGIGTFIFVYADRYLGSDENRGTFFSYLYLFITAMLGVVLSSNLVSLYVFWEMTSIVSFLLIGFWFHRKASREGALKSLLVTMSGGLAMLAGFIMLYLATGTLEIQELIQRSSEIVQHPLYPAILVLVLLGAMTKSAQVPFHLWLPSAMEAPTPVSAYLHSATMVKAGLYLLLRFLPILGDSPLWFWIISLVGIITLFWGSLVAIRQTDLKAILAFSTISQLGLITTLIGWGSPLAVLAACTHIVNHAVFKAALFMVVGIVDHETGTRDIRKLHRLARFMPITAAIAAVAGLALAGIPGFNGFVSKELFLDAMLELSHNVGGGTWIFPALAVAGSALTMVYSLMIAHGIFFDRNDAAAQADSSARHPHEAPWPLLFPPFLLAGLSLLFGWLPDSLQGNLVNAASRASRVGLAGESFHLHAFAGWTPAFSLSLLIILTGLVLYLLRARIVPVLRAMPGTPTVNQIYDGSIDFMMAAARGLTRQLMTGFLADSFGYMLAFLLLISGAAFLATLPLPTLSPNLAPVTWYEAVLLVIGAIAALFTLVARSRMTAILSLSVVGLVVVVTFIFAQAPDLALTQLIVETVTLILFLVVFRHLPALKPEQVSWTSKLQRGVVSILSGALLTGLILWVNATPGLEKEITRYYIDHSVDQAGGHNIVNVILVDFRGFDTMGEITVVAMAALGVYALVKMRPGGKQS